MSIWQKVTIAGVGLMGASIGLALRTRRIASQVVGYGPDPTSLRIAQDRGAIDLWSTQLDEAINDAELIIVCAPVGQISHLLTEASRLANPNVLMTDVGSTKQSIVSGFEATESFNRVRYVGSHPLAGSDKSGPIHASAELLENRTVVLTPNDTSDRATVDDLKKLWSSCGANTIEMTPQEHDRSMACVSHLPHVLASVLAGTTPDNELSMVATGWCDTTRIASGDPQLWLDILSDNREALVESVQRFQSALQRFVDDLISDEQQQLLEALQLGKKQRDAVGS